MRWRQDRETGKLIPIDDAAIKASGAAVHGDIQSFVSPIDGSVITDRKQYREHMEKHGVVPAGEFSDDYLAKQRKKREDFYNGVHTPEEKFKRKQEIYNHWVRAENEH